MSGRPVTRRQLVLAIAPAAALAQTPSAATPADELKAALARQHANSDALSKLQVPMEIEPAFQFRA